MASSSNTVFINIIRNTDIEISNHKKKNIMVKGLYGMVNNISQNNINNIFNRILLTWKDYSRDHLINNNECYASFRIKHTNTLSIMLYFKAILTKKRTLHKIQSIYCVMPKVYYEYRNEWIEFKHRDIFKNNNIEFKRFECKIEHIEEYINNIIDVIQFNLNLNIHFTDYDIAIERRSLKAIEQQRQINLDDEKSIELYNNSSQYRVSQVQSDNEIREEQIRMDEFLARIINDDLSNNVANLNINDMVVIISPHLKNITFNALCKNNKISCDICLDDNITIDKFIGFSCGHYCCKGCLNSIDKCHLCRKLIRK
jgi:hypothetical protein